MRVLVTGGTGVVGQAVIPALLRAGHKVRLLSRHANGEIEALPDGVEPFEADIVSASALENAIAGCECVLHLAGIVEEEPPQITFEAVNVGGTRNVINAAKKAGQPRVIYVSSLGADRGASAYHQSKRRAEDLVRAYHGPWVILRPGNVYGPGDETLSLLLKMVRTLPAVPMVAHGDQPFQPVWHEDLAEVIQQVVDQPELTGETLELAGRETTTTDDVLRRLGEITGRNVPRLSVPVWMTEVGVQMLEAFGAAGKKLLRRAGMDAPITSAKLDMLLEGNVIQPGAGNDLERFVPEPVTLQDGLEMLADMQTELLPGDGVGALREATYSAEIEGASCDAPALLDRVCENIRSVMPIEFAAEPASPTRARVGETLTAAISARGNVQVRLEERTPTRATFVTLEGHPLAGVMQLHTEDLGDGRLRFNVHLAAQPANAIDWVAMRTLGDPMQRTNWRGFVRRVVTLSGGQAPDGVKQTKRVLSESEGGDIRRFAERVTQAQQRAERSTG